MSLNKCVILSRNNETPYRRLLNHALVLLSVAAFAGASLSAAQVSNLTRSGDLNRTGANLNETILTPANVNSANFGKLYTVPIDAQVYAQPLYVAGLTIGGAKHDVVFVASMRNSVYAIDAPTGTILWQKNYGPWVNPQHVQGATNIAANTGVGIVSTPVIDPATNIMYFVSKHEQIVNANVPAENIYEFHLNAIDIRTGAPVLGSPVVINATYSTADLVNPLVFNARKQNQRSGLALANGNIYFAFASHDDIQPYHGWVMSYSATNLKQMAVYSDTTIGTQGGIWQAGSAPTIDSFGQVYLSTGNGSFGATPNGLMQTGNSFIKLSPNLELLDYFTPFNSAKLNAGDQDLGASGLLLIPGTDYLLGGGKQGVLYLVDKENMGKFNSAEDQVRQEFQAVYGKGTSHIHSLPTYFNSAKNGPTIYVWGENDVLRGYQFNTSTGMMSPVPLAMGTLTAPATHNNGAMPGGFTTISANGSTNGIVWASTPYNGDAQFTSVQGVLYAYDADTLNLLWTDKTQDARDDVGRFAKHVPPVVANGRMFIPTFGTASDDADGTGQLVAYGLLPVLTVNVTNLAITSGAALPALTGTVTGLSPSDHLGNQIVVTYSTTATSASPVGTYPITATVSGSSVLNYRVTVNAGTLTISAPSSGGGGTGGTPSVNYPNGFTGSNLQLNGSAALNGSRLRLVDGGLNEAASAFYPTKLNVQGFVNDFTFQSTKPSADGLTMLIQNDGPTALGGLGIALGFGPGSRPGIVKGVAVKFDFFNNNGEGIDSTGLYLGGQKPTVPAIDLTGTGIVLKSNDIFQVHAVYNGTLLNVTITDTTTGATSTQSYTIDIPGKLGSTTGYVGFSAGTGAQSSTEDILTWSYSPLPSYKGNFDPSQLTLNGGAAITGGNLRLVDQKAYEARSAFFTNPVNVQQFSSSFTFKIANPKADGLVFVVQGAGPTALGGAGYSIGVGPTLGKTTGGIANSVALKFDLYNNQGEGPNSTGLFLNGVPPFTPSIDLTGTGIDLHSGNPISALLIYNGTTLKVTLTDTVTAATATQSYTVNIPGVVGAATGYVGFTAGSGALSSTADVLNWNYTPGPPLK